MASELLKRVHELLQSNQSKNKNQAKDAAEAQVDANLLGQLLADTYRQSEEDAEKRSKIASRILETISEYDSKQVSAGSDAAGPESKAKIVAVGIATAEDVAGSPVGSASNGNESQGSSESHTPLKIPLSRFEQFLQNRTKQLYSMFQRLDKDKDNRIDINDVFTYLDTTGVQYDPAKIKAIFNTVLDANGDGEVTVDDFVTNLVLVPLAGEKGRFFQKAYKFFMDDLEISADSDVLLSAESSNGLGYFWAGGMAGVVSRTCTAPFDRLKVFLIAQSSSNSMTTWQAVRHIYSLGWQAFFVGNGLNVLKVFPESAMKFGGFETAKKVFAYLEGVDDTADLSRGATFVAGGVGGMVSQLCVYPIDTVKFRVQCETAITGKTDGVLAKTVKNMVKDGGIRPFYRGLYVGVLGIFPFAALDLGIFSAFKKAYIRREARKRNIDPNEVHIGNLVVLTMGATSGSFGASVVYPVNLVRTRIQTQGTAAHPYRYKGFLDCCHQTYLREGWKGFFRGLGPNLAKVAPSVSISYLVYENAKRIMGLH